MVYRNCPLNVTITSAGELVISIGITTLAHAVQVGPRWPADEQFNLLAKVTDEHVFNVKIPQGVREGQHIRLSGQGSPGVGGGPAGDLFLEVHFRDDPRYRVQERDVYETVPVAPWEAALGAAIEVPTPSGTVKVTVPAQSKAGRKLRLKGRGIPGNPPGDLYLELDIALPPADTPKARQFYEIMAREMAFDPRRDLNATQKPGA